MSKPDDKSDPVIIKKYANRRLYNTGSSSYITLDHLAAMTREGVDFKVIDAKSGEDITRSVLTQIIMDEETRGQTMLPTPFLRQLIAMYGDSLQSMVPAYLEASMAALRRNQEQFRKSMAGAVDPFEALTRQNLRLLEAATGMMTGTSAAEKQPAKEGGDIDELKREMEALKAKLDKLSG